MAVKSRLYLVSGSDVDKTALVDPLRQRVALFQT